jgi:protein-tyrosine phosphatase
MLDIACAGGTSDIVATPHANAQYEYRRNEHQQLLATLQQAAGSRIRIHLGCDLHLDYELVELAIADPASYSIAGAGYVLIEPPESFPAKTFSEVCKRMLDAGLRPILTHPERYATLQRRERQIESWIGEGILMQVTAGSLLGQFGGAARQTAERMIAGGLAHFCASDAHDTRGRSPDLSEACRLVEDRWGETAAALLTGGPVKTVTVRARRWFSFAR